MKTNRILFKLGLGTVLMCVLLLGVGAIQHQQTVRKTKQRILKNETPIGLAADIRKPQALLLPETKYTPIKW